MNRPALSLCLLFAPAGLRADPVAATARFAWVRGADADRCPDGAVLRETIARRMHRDPFDDHGPRSLEALVEHGPAGWSATLRIRDRDGDLLGERTLTHPGTDCTGITEASILAVALAIDPDAVLDEPAPEPAPTAPAPPRRTAWRSRTLPPPPPWRLHLRGEALAGPLPAVGLGGALGVELPLGSRFSLPLWVGYVAPQAADDARFLFGATRLGIGLCARFGDRVALRVCPQVGARITHAFAQNTEAIHAGEFVQVALGAEVGGEWWVSRGVALTATVAPELSLSRARFYRLPDRAAIFTQSLVGLTASLGVVFASPVGAPRRIREAVAP